MERARPQSTVPTRLPSIQTAARPRVGPIGPTRAMDRPVNRTFDPGAAIPRRVGVVAGAPQVPGARPASLPLDRKAPVPEDVHRPATFWQRDPSRMPLMTLWT